MAKRSTSRKTQTKVTGGTPELREAAKKAAGREDSNTTADAVGLTVTKERHTRLAQPGETPDTKLNEFETKVDLRPAGEETHTRLATPDDPEAKAQQKEVRAAAKARGEPVEVVQKGENTPEAQPTPREARAAAQKLFDKADEAGKAEMIADNQRRNAALGY